MVVLPLSTSSQSALIANLGSLTVTNGFSLAADVVRERHGSVTNPDGFLSPKRQPAIVDKMTVTLTKIQFGRLEDTISCIVLNCWARSYSDEHTFTLALFPGYSQFFNVTRRKTVGPGIRSTAA